eukprot:TRINITY_DN1276_c0_g1_i1.p1 TRINITY_DN1276_c0_g1~~TRINITY_DN1276_c0_g1_i1.p1  ORF type:complete len:1443 (-),score=208.04 TRINITY_DN1276_c0_g1_i1:9-4337(-)
MNSTASSSANPCGQYDLPGNRVGCLVDHGPLLLANVVPPSLHKTSSLSLSLVPPVPGPSRLSDDTASEASSMMDPATEKLVMEAVNGNFEIESTQSSSRPQSAQSALTHSRPSTAGKRRVPAGSDSSASTPRQNHTLDDWVGWNSCATCIQRWYRGYAVRKRTADLLPKRSRRLARESLAKRIMAPSPHTTVTPYVYGGSRPTSASSRPGSSSRPRRASGMHQHFSFATSSAQSLLGVAYPAFLEASMTLRREELTSRIERECEWAVKWHFLCVLGVEELETAHRLHITRQAVVPVPVALMELEERARIVRQAEGARERTARGGILHRCLRDLAQVRVAVMNRQTQFASLELIESSDRGELSSDEHALHIALVEAAAKRRQAIAVQQTQLLQTRHRQAAAETVQRAIRTHWARLESTTRRREREAARTEKARQQLQIFSIKKIQALWRGHVLRMKRKRLQTQQNHGSFPLTKQTTVENTCKPLFGVSALLECNAEPDRLIGLDQLHAALPRIGHWPTGAGLQILRAVSDGKASASLLFTANTPTSGLEKTAISGNQNEECAPEEFRGLALLVQCNPQSVFVQLLAGKTTVQEAIITGDSDPSSSGLDRLFDAIQPQLPGIQLLLSSNANPDSALALLDPLFGNYSGIVLLLPIQQQSITAVPKHRHSEDLDISGLDLLLNPAKPVPCGLALLRPQLPFLETLVDAADNKYPWLSGLLEGAEEVIPKKSAFDLLNQIAAADPGIWSSPAIPAVAQLLRLTNPRLETRVADCATIDTTPDFEETEGRRSENDGKKNGAFEEAAAIRIQALHRGAAARRLAKEQREIKQQENAAIRIQAVQRGSQARKLAQEERKAQETARLLLKSLGKLELEKRVEIIDASDRLRVQLAEDWVREARSFSTKNEGALPQNPLRASCESTRLPASEQSDPTDDLLEELLQNEEKPAYGHSLRDAEKVEMGASWGRTHLPASEHSDPASDLLEDLLREEAAAAAKAAESAAQAATSAAEARQREFQARLQQLEETKERLKQLHAVRLAKRRVLVEQEAALTQQELKLRAELAAEAVTAATAAELAAQATKLAESERKMAFLEREKRALERRNHLRFVHEHLEEGKRLALDSQSERRDREQSREALMRELLAFEEQRHTMDHAEAVQREVSWRERETLANFRRFEMTKLEERRAENEERLGEVLAQRQRIESLHRQLEKQNSTAALPLTGASNSNANGLTGQHKVPEIPEASRASSSLPSLSKSTVSFESRLRADIEAAKEQLEKESHDRRLRVQTEAKTLKSSTAQRSDPKLSTMLVSMSHDSDIQDDGKFDTWQRRGNGRGKFLLPEVLPVRVIHANHASSVNPTENGIWDNATSYDVSRRTLLAPEKAHVPPHRLTGTYTKRRPVEATEPAADLRPTTAQATAGGRPATGHLAVPRPAAGAVLPVRPRSAVGLM